MIYLVTHYYPPVSNPPATRISRLARILAETYGADQVTVVTGRPNHPDGKLRPGFRFRPFKRTLGPAGERVLHLYEIPAPNKGFFLKSLGFLSFGLSVFFFFLFRRLRPGDLVYVTSPPAFASYGLTLLSYWKPNLRFVFEVRDLMPQIVAGMGFLRKESLLYRGLLRISHVTYRRALHNVAVVEGIRDYIAGFSGPERVSLVHNAADLHLFTPKGDAHVQAFREQHAEAFGPPGSTSFIFIGSHSVYMDLRNVLNAFARLDSPSWRFLLIGYGEETEALKALATELGIADRVFFLGYRTREEVVDWLEAADYPLSTTIDAEIYRMVVPTKMLEYLALGKFVLSAHDAPFAYEMQERGYSRNAFPGDTPALAAILSDALAGRLPRSADSAAFIRERYSDERFAVLQRELFARWIKD